MSLNEADWFARTYGMELLFEEPPRMDLQAALVELQQLVGPVEHLVAGEASDVFYYQEHTVSFTDVEAVPAQVSIFRSNAEQPRPVDLSALPHSWATPHADSLAARTRSRALVTDMMSSGLPPQQRHALLKSTITCLAKHSNCIGLAALRTEQLIVAREFVESSDPLFGFLNVRFFNAGDGTFVMDTIGLAALGLYDVQCHFTGLEPGEVSATLYNIGHYVFYEDPSFEKGHTVDGARGALWTVQFEESLVGPKRPVLDLNPGRDFAAGR